MGKLAEEVRKNRALAKKNQRGAKGPFPHGFRALESTSQLYVR